LSAPVDVPKKVLDLFPSWEYRCPKCGVYVDSEVASCPQCEARFEVSKWRFPPRFLKSAEAMADYAHKVLAPRLKPEERRLLFEYFTEFFNDGFESGDFSQWNGVSGGVVVQSNTKHHGSYAAQLTDNGDGFYVTLGSSYTELYARAYFYFNTLPTAGQFSALFSFFKDGLYRMRTGLLNNGGVLQVYMSDIQWLTANYAFNPLQWYCWEIKWDSDSDEYGVFINGSQVLSSNASSSNDVNRVNIGFSGYWTDQNLIVDCVVVADTPVGVESEQQAYTKTWATDSLFKKLGITQAFSLDTALQKKGIQETFGVTSHFSKIDTTKSFAVDVTFFRELVSRTVFSQIDLLIKKFDATTSFGLNAYFGLASPETGSESFGLDAVFAYRVRLPELWLDQNGKLVLNISKPYAWVGLT
jgi:hypothetical protein